MLFLAAFGGFLLLLLGALALLLRKWAPGLVLLALGGSAWVWFAANNPSNVGVVGRPLRRRGRLLLPETTEPTAADPARAAAWVEAARGEHASVPAFALLSLRLTAVGAPLDLVEAAHRAAVEEVDHTRRALAMAARHGAAAETGALPGLRGLRVGRRWTTRRGELARLAVESLRDGCLAEGEGARAAADRAATAADPVERTHQAVIARDEAGHAELAWSVLAWCLAEGGEPVVRAVRSALDRLPATADRAAVARRAAPLLALAGRPPVGIG